MGLDVGLEGFLGVKGSVTYRTLVDFLTIMSHLEFKGKVGVSLLSLRVSPAPCSYFESKDRLYTW
jgi:hypothetical protein